MERILWIVFACTIISMVISILMGKVIGEKDRI